MTFFLFKIFSAILNFLAPPQKYTPPAPGKFADISFPRAAEGDSVPRWYGTLKYQGANTIWDGDFGAFPITKKVKTGLFSKKKETVGFNYKFGLDLAICLGPNFTFRRIWLGTYELWNGCLTGCENFIELNLPNLFGGTDNKNGNSGGGFIGRIALYCGSFTQSANDYLQRVIFPDNSNQVPAYNGVAHMVFEQPVWGTSTSILPVYVEGSCFYDTLGIGAHNIMPNGLDMNAVSIVHHILTDDWGCLDIDPAKIDVDQWKSVAENVYNSGIGGSSLLVGSQSAASDAIKTLLTQINATIFEDPATGLYQLVDLSAPYEIADLPVFGPSEVKSVANFTKTLWSQTQNIVRVKFTDRTQGYKENVSAVAQDFANIRFQDKPKPNEITTTSVYDPNVANMYAARELANVNVPLYSATLTLDRTANPLAPGTPFVFNWPEYGIVQMVLRVRKAGLGTLNDGTITLDVVQDVFSVQDVIMAPPVTSPYTPPTSEPQPIVAPNVFELPYWLDYNAGFKSPDTAQTIGIFAKAPSSFSLGFNANIGDAQVLDLAPYASTAKLTTVLGLFDGFANGFVPTLIVGSVTNADILEAGDVTTGSGLFMLNTEILAYESYVANGDGTYTLHNIHRALLDTVYTAGAIGDMLYFFDGQDDFLEDAFPVAIEFDLKLADVTVSGAYQTPAAIPVTPLGRLSRPIPPDGLTLAGARAVGGSIDAGDTATLAWAPRSRLASPTAIPLEMDPAQTPEDGTTYRIGYLPMTGPAVVLADDVADPTYDVAFVDAMAPRVLLMVWAKVGGVLSINPALYPVAVVGELLIDGDAVTIDGEGISI